MHELSLAMALVEQVEQEARRHGARSVHRVDIRVGELSGVEAAMLASAYEVIREGTACAGAELVVTRVAAVWACPRCDAPIPVGGVLRCPACDEPARLRQGDEIELERIEVEVNRDV